jgi:hypothetical protein
MDPTKDTVFEPDGAPARARVPTLPAMGNKNARSQNEQKVTNRDEMGRTKQQQVVRSRERAAEESACFRTIW